MLVGKPEAAGKLVGSLRGRIDRFDHTRKVDFTGFSHNAVFRLNYRFQAKSVKILAMMIARANRIMGTIELPGDKSISHRAALIAAIAEGTTRIQNYSPSEDCSATLRCLSALGVTIESDGADVIICGVGRDGLHQPDGPLDCGNSGTTMRMLAGILAGQPFESILTGDGSLSSRPMRRIVEPLVAMGAVIEMQDGHAPLTMRGRRPLTAISYELSVASAQVKSCVMLAGLFADGNVIVREPTATRDHTERMLQWFGGMVKVAHREITISNETKLTGRDVVMPGDISAAAFFMTAAACLEGSDIEFPNIGINPTRSAVIDVLGEIGADVAIRNRREVGNEPVADVRVRGGLRKSEGRLVIASERTTALIDELPILAVLGTQLSGGIEVRDASELRVKESDRITAMVTNLRHMRADVTEFNDGFFVKPSRLRGAKVESCGDHRIAMAMAVAALLADGETEIVGAECVDVSFPGFFDVLRSVVS